MKQMELFESQDHDPGYPPAQGPGGEDPAPRFKPRAPRDLNKLFDPVTIHIQVEKSCRIRLDELCFEYGVSMSRFVREAIEEQLKKNGY